MSHENKKHHHRDESPDKHLQKALETPEQKRLRRFAKKEAKDRKRKEELGWDAEYMGYTNSDNPYGDTNLLEKFVWKKKLEKEGLKHITKDEIERRSRLNKIELDKVKERRLQREREREMREEEMTKIQREKEAAQFSEYEKQEYIFHLQQAKLRSKIRIQNGRAKPIDLLARYCSSEEEDCSVEFLCHEPYTYLNGLKIEDLENLLEDIKIYMEMENENKLEFWKDIQIIVEDEISRARDEEKKNVGDRRESINSAVGCEIVAIFKGKTPKQLQAMYKQIEKKLSSADETLDVAYWETLLSRLNAYMARARLREKHEENLKQKLFKLKEEQGVTAKDPPLFPCVSGNTINTPTDVASTSTAEKSIASDVVETPSAKERSDPEDGPFTLKSEKGASTSGESRPLKASNEEVYDSGRYSPTLIPFEKLEPGVIVIDEVEDAQRIEFRQNRVFSSSSDDALTTEEKAFEKIARQEMGPDEAVFSVEHPVHQTYLLSDKYRPRKPRYFNRVHTGFEWNKYNQTHYDMDNPPPKIVQGYKFNIFYPDLIDKSKTPEYTLTPCDDNKDFAILRFHAGPPYEDIAFKIINREMEYSYKKGFRCQFHNNIFQLYFHFKRYRYRR
ncbi:splicing factor Cactin-like [Uloborus diversus]|uniref:splicing factor Cactin-like n=1 Tax=Uloborus diversus TaxID=327109 RepID=UPI00240A0BEC|nr:splicing factor Cactin-like [Uloborus diversus]